MAQAHQNNFWESATTVLKVGLCGTSLALLTTACSGNHKIAPQPPSANLCPNISSRYFVDIASGNIAEANKYINIIALRNNFPKSIVIAGKTYTGAILKRRDSTCTYVVDRAPPVVKVTRDDAASSNLFTRTYDYDGEFLNEELSGKRGQPTR